MCALWNRNIKKCCIVNCTNTNQNSVCEFYSFSLASWKRDQRAKWIAAVNRKNVDGSPWSPRRQNLICSAHFIGGKKSDDPANSSYVPTIFPEGYQKSQNQFALAGSSVQYWNTEVPPTSNEPLIENNNISEVNLPQHTMIDKSCQIDMYCESQLRDTTFTCIRYIYNDRCEAEIQVEIATTPKIVFKKQKNKSCGTPNITYESQSTMTNNQDFIGISSIQNDQQLIDLAGVSFNNFEFLLKKISMSKCSVSKKDRFLIFLMKIKTGLTFSALGVIFGVHRTTISRIFYSILEDLVSATANLVFWPDKRTIQATMPECFLPTYGNTRVIIDCTEFRIEIPAAVDDRVICYSHYKKGFTAKILIGITPGGFISFKSRVAGGRKTDSQMTVESGIIDLLETGDVVLADKGFPEIKKVLDESGKEVNIIMPPFLKSKTEFSKQETEQTYDIARVRIHVERIMQRLRVYRILDKIPHNLFHNIDNIVHICCVLVNLQPPIFAIKDRTS